METQVFAPMFRDLSNMDRQVLETMSGFQEDEIRLRDLAHATGKTTSYLGVYAERLRDAGLIHRPARGRMRFVHSTMRDWLRRERATDPQAAADPDDPMTTTTVRERIIAAHHETPEATHIAIAERVGTSADYAGRVRRGLQNQE